MMVKRTVFLKISIGGRRRRIFLICLLKIQKRDFE
jgi:hypothetical protein